MSRSLPPSWYNLGFLELQLLLEAENLSPVHARTLWKALYREQPVPVNEREDFLPPLKRWVKKQTTELGWVQQLPEIAVETPSNDGLTRKYLLRLADGEKIETVLMGYPGRFTACLSTQAGCAMGCVFCATGQLGFARHLTPGEIVAQVLIGRKMLPDQAREGLRNLVLMGMGEPLHNYDSVMTALEIITDTRGLNIGPSRITISTVGVIPGIRRLADEGRPYNLAVSLHGADEADRVALVPVSRRWPLLELMEACRYYVEKTGRRIFFEWTLIAGVNDSVNHARKVASLLEGIDAHLNLIALNKTAGYAGGPTKSALIEDFQGVIQRAGFPCTVRARRGIDVAAGCGQLASDSSVLSPGS